MSRKYDVVIIGAGIGGLVCGCYLAKAGLKVLLAEQHYQPGGCCTSFKRNGYIFDVGVHYLGSLREDGILSKVLKDFNILNRINFLRNDPTDRIILNNETIFIRQDKNNTRKELLSHFPREKENINRFFNFILNDDFLYVVSKTKKLSFKELLDTFFKNEKLKAFLSIPLGNIGLPPSKASALVAAALFEEYIFDGGYFPQGGVQVLPDLLASRFKEYGGELLLSARISKIVTQNNMAKGVELNGEFIPSEVVVSNADATLTFDELLKCDYKETQVLNKLKVSPSAFVIYLGLNKSLKISPKHYTTWYFSSGNIEKCYDLNDVGQGLIPNLDYVICTFSSLIDESLAPKGKGIMRIFIGAQFAEKKVWEDNKDTLSEVILRKVNDIVPNLSGYIEEKIIATPYTFFRYTLNKNGAIFGLAATYDQIDRNIFPSITSIDNLYLTGHWTTNGIGQSSVSLVALSGRNISKVIIRKLSKKTITIR